MLFSSNAYIPMKSYQILSDHYHDKSWSYCAFMSFLECNVHFQFQDFTWYIMYDVFYWTKIVWHWLQHRVIMINHDISWYITKYQIISDNIMIYHDISRFIMIYHDISWYIKNYQVNSEHWKLTLNSENDIKVQ